MGVVTQSTSFSVSMRKNQSCVSIVLICTTSFDILFCSLGYLYEFYKENVVWHRDGHFYGAENSTLLISFTSSFIKDHQVMNN